ELKDLLLDEANRDLETRARLVSDILERNEGPVEPAVLRAADVSGTRVTVIAHSGAVLADSEARADDMEDHSSRPEVRQAMKTGFGTSMRFSSTRNADYLYVAVRDTSRENAQVIRVA